MNYVKGLKNYLECESLLKQFFDTLNLCGKNTECSNWCKCGTEDITKNYHSRNANPLLNQERIKTYGTINQESACPYITEKGCKLKTHKPVICISYACPGLTEFLKENNIDYKWNNIESSLLDVIMNTKENNELKNKINKMIEQASNINKPEQINPKGSLNYRITK